MKTNELIEKVNHLGLKTEVDNHNILINGKDGRTVCTIKRNQCFQLDINYYFVKEKLLEIVLQYASTPIDEREIEPKYKLALRIVNNQVDEDSQLILLWDSRFNRIDVGKCTSVNYIVRYMKHVDNQPYKDIHYIYTQKEWEEKLKTSWETIPFIYHPIMIK